LKKKKLDTGESKMKKILLILLFLLMINDVVTTNIIIGQGGIELNFLMRPIVENTMLHIVIKIIAVVFILFLSKKIIGWISKTNNSLPRYVSYNLTIIALMGWFAFVGAFNLMSLL
jgi:uncharacterized protein HemY